MIFEVTAIVGDAVRMLQPNEEANLFEYVLPLVEGLLAPVGHLFDGHHFGRDIVSRKTKGLRERLDSGCRPRGSHLA